MNPRQVLDQRDDVQILDVRETDEWAGGHIEGAHHIPMNDVPARLAEIDRDRLVVTVCRSGSRSGQVAAYLAQSGFTAHNTAPQVLGHSGSGKSPGSQPLVEEFAVGPGGSCTSIGVRSPVTSPLPEYSIVMKSVPTT